MTRVSSPNSLQIPPVFQREHLFCYSCLRKAHETYGFAPMIRGKEKSIRFTISERASGNRVACALCEALVLVQHAARAKRVCSLECINIYARWTNERNATARRLPFPSLYRNHLGLSPARYWPFAIFEFPVYWRWRGSHVLTQLLNMILCDFNILDAPEMHILSLYIQVF